MSEPPGRGASRSRTAAMAHARAEDSRRKREAALGALEALERAGSPVTFASVANVAGVSRWLLYSQPLRGQVEAARRRQCEHGATAALPPAAERTSTASWRTDLMVARDEIRRLRSERDELVQRLRLHLGAEIEGPEMAQLLARVADLERANLQLVAERDARAVEANAAKSKADALEDDLSAARESLRRVIRDTNRTR